MASVPIMYTVDRQVITDGMRVWDYDLDRVTVDLSRMTDSVTGEFFREPDPMGQYWFDVRTESGGRKTMSDTRVVVRHPFTGEIA